MTRLMQICEWTSYHAYWTKWCSQSTMQDSMTTTKKDSVRVTEIQNLWFDILLWAMDTEEKEKKTANILFSWRIFEANVNTYYGWQFSQIFPTYFIVCVGPILSVHSSKITADNLIHTKLKYLAKIKGIAMCFLFCVCIQQTNICWVFHWIKDVKCFWLHFQFDGDQRKLTTHFNVNRFIFTVLSENSVFFLNIELMWLISNLFNGHFEKQCLSQWFRLDKIRKKINKMKIKSKTVLFLFYQP